MQSEKYIMGLVSSFRNRNFPINLRPYFKNRNTARPELEVESAWQPTLKLSSLKARSAVLIIASEKSTSHCAMTF